MRGYHSSWAVMNEAARRLGAPDARAFLAIASPSMQCAFKLICKLIAEYDPPPGSPEWGKLPLPKGESPFRTAERALLGQRWSTGEAEQLRELVDVGAAQPGSVVVRPARPRRGVAYWLAKIGFRVS